MKRSLLFPSPVSTALAGVLVLACAWFNAGCVTTRQPKPPPVTVPQVVEMSRQGVTPDDIIARMRASGTVYRLSAAQMVALQHQGVSTTVLDYMQQTYIDAVEADAQYEAWDRWTMINGFWYGGVPYGWPTGRVFIIRQAPPPPRPPHH